MTAARPDLDRLLGSIPVLLTTTPLADRQIGDAFAEATASLSRYDHIVVFAYRGSERPIDLYSTFDADDYRTFVTLYQAGPYLLDPFYHAAAEPRPGIFRMRDLAPDRFFSSEYYRTYYSQTRLAEEIGFFVPVDGNVTVVLSLMRKSTDRAFSARDFERLRQADPFVAAMVRRFWSGLAERFDAVADVRKTASSRATGVWGRLDLTAREASIVELVLQGHSSEAVGRRLGIATGTVKVHRRNVYRKLGISSQTQLLSLYLKSM